ncbi:MAG: M28 family peptidase [Lentisphaeraceae bacterium]|nr:M28 family peptidase [Lentisphaeraceae bacterium]
MLISRSQNAKPLEVSPLITSHLSNISKDYLEKFVRDLAFPRHRIQEPDENKRAAELIFNEFQKLGYEVKYQGKYRNVMAWKGDLKDKKVVVVGAHYDSVPKTPGADDNASAVAAMMGIAKSLSSQESLPIVYVAYNCEEENFEGSKSFVGDWLENSNCELLCAHILEMLAYRKTEPGSQKIPPGLPIKLPDTADFLGLISHGPTRKVKNLALKVAKTYTPEVPVLALQMFFGLEKKFKVLWRSDHVPFWLKGLPALMWTDTSEYRNPHYHKTTDTPETLDFDFLLSNTKVVTATILSQLKK